MQRQEMPGKVKLLTINNCVCEIPISWSKKCTVLTDLKSFFVQFSIEKTIYGAENNVQIYR